MTALADVLFQLLIFFMLSANLAAYSLLPLRSGALRGESGGEAAGTSTAVTETSATAIWTLNPDGIVASGQRFGLDRMQALIDALALQQTRHVLIILRPDVPVPPNWGGYLIAPEVIEFWQGRENRVHNRIRITGDRIERLQP